jgi:Calcineurin-like phosphoesterase
MSCARFFFFLSFLWFVSSCHSDPKPQTKKYLFLSHIYQWGVADNNRIDYRFEGFDFKYYDQIWLGGDLCARTSESPATLEYLDSIFNLSSDRTHWALGNHDLIKGDVNFITEKTHRKTYYSDFFNGIGIVVLNTTEFYHPQYQPKNFECALLDRQLQMLENIADTIKRASHLIVLHHLPLLNNQMTDDSLDIGKLFNYYHPEYLTSCKIPSTFEKVFFPIFKKIQKKGVQVITIGGDLGQRSKEFEYRSKEGIYFLGSGINNSAIAFNLPDYVTNTSPDKLLIFKHDISKKELSWEFVELNSFIENNKKSSTK